MKSSTKIASLGIGTITIILALIIAAVTAFSSINIIQDGTVGVVRRFGEIQETITPGGWNMRLSWIHDVEIFDVRVQEVDLRVNAYSIDAQNIRGHVSIQYRINPGAVEQIARQFGAVHVLEGMLHAMLLQEVQNVFALKTAMELVEQRAVLSGEIWDRLRLLQDNFHVTITNVALEDLTFTQAFRDAVDQRVVADQRLMQAQIDAETARVQAQLALDVARLEAEAVLVAARVDAEALQIMQEAWGDLGSEVREIMLRQLAIEAWDGVLPQVISGGDGFSLILDSFTPMH
jgi:regulator of protease activity HflC (stomatin/prohibitin superfamily)